ncbi:GNAT family N-acetyltransferase, partial [Candidatus Roizmanbacteria bacterium]|nr:GNAT family N-acetyltransferase [Candidatus Roizmanbacteria bacterium]
LAEIGHNCILPEYRGNGYGKSQIQHALGEIKKQGFTKVIVSTNKNDDFIPAQRQYIACGFHETGDFIREDGDLMIGYELMF